MKYLDHRRSNLVAVMLEVAHVVVPMHARLCRFEYPDSDIAAALGVPKVTVKQSKALALLGWTKRRRGWIPPGPLTLQ